MHALKHAIARWAQYSLLAVVHFYRLFFKAWLGNRCRFEPSCSSYALQALTLHGVSTGTALTARRLLRCHPWCQAGLDPVPEPAQAPFKPYAGLFTCWPSSPPDHPPGTLRPWPRKLP